MNKLLSNPKAFPHIISQLNEVRAYYFLKQKKYDLAIEPLESAINTTSSKKSKARFSYIIAQIYQNSKREAEALVAYNRTLKLHPAYEMEFNTAKYCIEQSSDRQNNHSRSQKVSSKDA